MSTVRVLVSMFFVCWLLFSVEFPVKISDVPLTFTFFIVISQFTWLVKGRKGSGSLMNSSCVVIVMFLSTDDGIVLTDFFDVSGSFWFSVFVCSLILMRATKTVAVELTLKTWIYLNYCSVPSDVQTLMLLLQSAVSIDTFGLSLESVSIADPVSTFPVLTSTQIELALTWIDKWSMTWGGLMVKCSLSNHWWKSWLALSRDLNCGGMFPIGYCPIEHNTVYVSYNFHVITV